MTVSLEKAIYEEGFMGLDLFNLEKRRLSEDMINCFIVCKSMA